LNGEGCISRLINELARLPGIGKKTAERLAFFIMKSEEKFGNDLAQAIIDVKKNVRFCSICYNFSEKELCDICKNPSRNKKIICVVEEPKDIWVIEKSGIFKGVYHVLMGAISPLDGIGPDKIKIRELLRRLEEQEVEEVIIATDPDIEGDATALYIARLIKPLGIQVTRIASGLPVGGDLEYADSVTLSRAISGRRPI